MSIPPAEHPCWERLATGTALGFQTQQLSMQFLLKRLQREPMSPQMKAKEVHIFFTKYERILGPEIAQLSRV